MAQSKLQWICICRCITFCHHLNEDTFNPKELHEDVVYNVIFYMTKSAQIDGHIEDKEMRLLSYLLQSSNLEEARIKEWNHTLKTRTKKILKLNTRQGYYIENLFLNYAFI